MKNCALIALIIFAAGFYSVEAKAQDVVIFAADEYDMKAFDNMLRSQKGKAKQVDRKQVRASSKFRKTVRAQAQQLRASGQVAGVNGSKANGKSNGATAGGGPPGLSGGGPPGLAGGGPPGMARGNANGSASGSRGRGFVNDRRGNGGGNGNANGNANGN